MMQSINIEHIHEKVAPVVKKAGELVAQYFYQDKVESFTKKDKSIVTQADLECERYLIQELSKILPEASFFAEESGGSEKQSAYSFVIDPIDGTTNFASGIPYFCISVCLTHKKKSLLGIVYQPLLKEYFHAIDGQGVFLNGKKLTHKPKDRARNPVILMGYKMLNSYISSVEHVLKGHSLVQNRYCIRYFGAAALDLAYLAMNRVDAVVYGKLAWWDVAAASLLVKEAGKLITSFEGVDVDYKVKSVLAGTSCMHDVLKKAFIMHNEG